MAPERLSHLQRHILAWLVTIARTPGGKAVAVDLTAAGRNRVTPLTASCE
jgi:hypothetical protein